MAAVCRTHAIRDRGTLTDTFAGVKLMPAEHGQHARQSEHDARGTADRQVAIRQVVLWRRLDLHDGYSIRDETNRGCRSI